MEEILGQYRDFENFKGRARHSFPVRTVKRRRWSIWLVEPSLKFEVLDVLLYLVAVGMWPGIGRTRGLSCSGNKTADLHGSAVL